MIHTKYLQKTFLAAGLTLAFVSTVSCSGNDEDTAEKRALQFAQNYFNLRYRQAASLCTKGSEKWIEYRAANIRQEDLDVLNAQADSAYCDIDNVSDDDDSATATIVVKNFLRCDSIGKKGYMCNEATYKVEMRKVDEKWMIDLKSPL